MRVDARSMKPRGRCRPRSLWQVRQPVYRRSVGPAGADTRRTSSHSRTREASMFQTMTVSDNFYAEPE